MFVSYFVVVILLLGNKSLAVGKLVYFNLFIFPH